MKIYEAIRLIGDPFIPLRNSKARRDLKRLLKTTQCKSPQLLDVGARTSPYTVGLPAQITLVDLPRQNEIQEKLNLGLTRQIMTNIRQNRSNIDGIVLEDMAHSTLPSESYDGVICIEVIEHVEDDFALVKRMARVLKSSGWLYLTTPNGDYRKNEPPHYNPDHVRHYTREQLKELLSLHFDFVDVVWGIKISRNRQRGMRGISLKQPISSLPIMLANLINRWESRGLENEPVGTAHLFATCYKAANSLSRE